MRCKEACVLLGFAASPEPLLADRIRPSTQQNSSTRVRVDTVEWRGPPGPTGDWIRPKATELERFACTSPWLTIFIELLSGEVIEWDKVWLYPFKQIIAYEYQMRKFVELLNQVDLISLKAKDMVHTLKGVMEQVGSTLGPKRRDIEYTDANIEKILKKSSHGFLTHFEKARQTPINLDNEKRTERMLGNETPMDQSNKTMLGEDSGEGLGMEKDRNKLIDTAEQEQLDATCTCLRDARDHLRLVIDVIDEDLASLMMIRRAVSDRSLKKIRFKDLWHLYQASDLVVTSKSPHQAYRVIFVSGGRPLLTNSLIFNGKERADDQDDHRRSNISPFRIECVKLDFDGNNFGPVHGIFNIDDYEDERKIVELEVYPIQFAENETALKETLVKRGEEFATYREFKHKRYTGLSLAERQEEVR